MHAAAWGIALTLVVAQLGGAWLQAAGYRRYVPRGAFYDVAVPGRPGVTQRVHAWCSGPRNVSRPSVWVEVGGGGHSSTDLLDVQAGLNAAGWRVCTYDVPGTGWSSYVVAHQPYVTIPLMDAMGEAGPFIMLGTMDDGPARAYAFALARPDRVRAVVPMQYGPPEFVTMAQFYHWSAADAAAHAAATTRARLALCDVIRGVAVQWGLIAAFVPGAAGNATSATEAEKLFLNVLNEKQWSSQCLTLAEWAADPADTILRPDVWQADRSLAPAIPVFAFENARPAAVECAAAGYAVGGDDCNLLNFTQAAVHAFMVNTTTMTAGSRLFSLPGGSADWLGSGDTRPWVVDTLVAAISGIVA